MAVSTAGGRFLPVQLVGESKVRGQQQLRLVTKAALRVIINFYFSILYRFSLDSNLNPFDLPL
jgi:hypothetical protein